MFDMSGGEVFDASYAALAPFGRIVVCGIATGEPNEVRTGSLLRHSRAVIGFYLFHCLGAPGHVRAGARATCSRVRRRGSCRRSSAIPISSEQAAQAQIDLRARRTTGKLLLDPSA